MLRLVLGNLEQPRKNRKPKGENMRIDPDVKLDFSDVLILPKRSTLSSRSEVSLEREMRFKHSNASWTAVPVIASNMDTVGSFAMARALDKRKMATCLHKFHPEPALARFYQETDAESRGRMFYSMGISKSDYEKFLRVQEQTGGLVQSICLDVANGYQESFVKFLGMLREVHPHLTIMAGNVVSREMTEHLILAGADIVKVGIGSGSACLTRRVAGVGCPQLSAILDCADAAHGLDGMICSDGGCVHPGDVAKAFAAGSDFTMLGGMLAGYDECDGEDVVGPDGKKYLKFHGMSSKEAMDQHYGGMAAHRASEGREVLVEKKGPVDDRLQEIMGGVRSACAYVGARKLKHLAKCATFIRVSRQLNDVFAR